MEKDSFILYNSFYEPIKALKNEQLGKLFRAIFNYTINGEITQDNEIIVAFMFIKNQIDLDSKKWEEQKKKRSEAGKKGMASRWNNNDNNVIKKNNNVKNAITNITDNVNVNENVNVNVNNNKHIYGEYKHVRLKDSEYEKLKNDFDNYEELIKYLDEYIEMKGYKAKSHYLAIRKWVVDAVNEKNKKENNVPIWFNKDIKSQEITKIEKEELDNLLKEFN